MLKNTKRNMDPQKKLLVEGINLLIRSELISLEVCQSEIKTGHLISDLFGYNSVISWRSVMEDEIEVRVWWKYDHELNPDLEKRLPPSLCALNSGYAKSYLGVVTSCFLERRNGKYIQGKGNIGIRKAYSRRGEIEYLKGIENPVPIGYLAEES